MQTQKRQCFYVTSLQKFEWIKQAIFLLFFSFFFFFFLFSCYYLKIKTLYLNNAQMPKYKIKQEDLDMLTNTTLIPPKALRSNKSHHMSSFNCNSYTPKRIVYCGFVLFLFVCCCCCCFCFFGFWLWLLVCSSSKLLKVQSVHCINYWLYFLLFCRCQLMVMVRMKTQQKMLLMKLNHCSANRWLV